MLKIILVFIALSFFSNVSFSEEYPAELSPAEQVLLIASSTPLENVVPVSDIEFDNRTTTIEFTYQNIAQRDVIFPFYIGATTGLATGGERKEAFTYDYIIYSDSCQIMDLRASNPTIRQLPNCSYSEESPDATGLMKGTFSTSMPIVDTLYASMTAYSYSADLESDYSNEKSQVYVPPSSDSTSDDSVDFSSDGDTTGTTTDNSDDESTTTDGGTTGVSESDSDLANTYLDFDQGGCAESLSLEECKRAQVAVQIIVSTLLLKKKKQD